MSHDDLVRRYIEALQRHDYDGVAELMHPEITARYPQSDEVFEGKESYRAMLEAFPDPPEVEIDRSTFDDTVVHVASPMPFGMPVITVVGGGDTFLGEGTVRYRSGDVWRFVSIIKVAEGLVKEETSYFAQPFEAPEWRAPFRSSE